MATCSAGHVAVAAVVALLLMVKPLTKPMRRLELASRGRITEPRMEQGDVASSVVCDLAWPSSCFDSSKMPTRAPGQ